MTRVDLKTLQPFVKPAFPYVTLQIVALPMIMCLVKINSLLLLVALFICDRSSLVRRFNDEGLLADILTLFLGILDK